MDFKEYQRDISQPWSGFSYIGNGELGGKAKGLFLMKEMLEAHFPQREFAGIVVDIPQMIVIKTDIFEQFMKDNNLYDVALNSIDDDYIAHEFQKGSLPVGIVGDLMQLITKINRPLAIRSSALLEDSLHEPFAGVYETKMIPNKILEATVRFNQLTEGIKFVYSTLYFKKAKQYFKAIRKDIRDEKMAVIIQEIVGDRYGDNFYPTVSGVIRSLNFYPIGLAKTENGVVQLALGLGKTIVEGGKTWCYSPRYPDSPPPYNNVNDLLENTQTKFWAVNMGQITEYDPTRETEYLVHLELDDAEKADNLSNVASTLSNQDDRINPGIAEAGARIINFAPILQCKYIELNDVIKRILLLTEEKLGEKVEIEFAVKIDRNSKEKPYFAFLQVRPLAVSNNIIEITKNDFDKKSYLIKPDIAMGNGESDTIVDIIYVKPDAFNPQNSREIAEEIEAINEVLLDQGRQYLLIGFGRWGTSDPWLGIPVTWSQISGVKAIVETTLPQLQSDFSQGSHFFHNVFSSGVFYFHVQQEQEAKINWKWLYKQNIVTDSKYVCHIRTDQALTIKVDGRSGEGVILK
jgi:hypothetical protein